MPNEFAGQPSTKVLVVEDETVLAMSMSRSIRKAGYEVVGPVATVSAALASLEKIRPDACVLDVGLRGQMSSPVALALKEQSIPFLLSTAYKADTLEWQQAFRGILNIGKPVEEGELLAALKSILRPH